MSTGKDITETKRILERLQKGKSENMESYIQRLYTFFEMSGADKKIKGLTFKFHPDRVNTVWLKDYDAKKYTTEVHEDNMRRIDTLRAAIYNTVLRYGELKGLGSGGLTKSAVQERAESNLDALQRNLADIDKRRTVLGTFKIQANADNYTRLETAVKRKEEEIRRIQEIERVRSSGYGGNSSASNSATAPTPTPTTAPATSKSFILKEVLGTRIKIRLEKFYNALLERLSNIGHPITVDLTTASGIVRLIDEANKYGLIFIFRPSGNIYNDIQREVISYYNNIIRDPHYNSFVRDPEQRRADAHAYIEYINQLDLNIDQNKQALIEAAIYEITLDDEKYKSYFPSVASTGGNSSASSSSAGSKPAPAPAATSSSASLTPEEKIQRVKDIADITNLDTLRKEWETMADNTRKLDPAEVKSFDAAIEKVTKARDRYIRVRELKLLKDSGNYEVTQIFNDIADICKLPQIKSERDVAFSNFTRDKSSENIRAYNLASSRYSRVFKVKEILGITDTPSSCSLQGGRRRRKSRSRKSHKSRSRKSRQSIRRSTSRKVKRHQ
jgi:hypothetical protein